MGCPDQFVHLLYTFLQFIIDHKEIILLDAFCFLPGPFQAFGNHLGTFRPSSL